MSRTGIVPRQTGRRTHSEEFHQLDYWTKLLMGTKILKSIAYTVYRSKHECPAGVSLIKMDRSLRDPKVRYRRILEPMRQVDAFTIEGIAAVCEGISPRYVRSVVAKLAASGWLESAPETPHCAGEANGHVQPGKSQSSALRWSRAPLALDVEQWIDNQVHGTQITQSPQEERPRERLLRFGPQHLRTAELFAILIRTGRPGESALQGGEKLANRFAEALHQLPASGNVELKQISTSISSPAYCQIMAGIELGRRVAESIARTQQKPTRLQSAEAAIDYCRQLFNRLALDGRQEEFHIVTLDTKYQPISNHRITVGTLDASLVHPREVFRPAIRDAASAVLLIHNHPSGDPTPSQEDRQVTRRLEKAAELIGINVIDHIIVAGETAISLKQWDLR
jgi:DNA repair protein RadC